jgi:putative sterol carrier protein
MKMEFLSEAWAQAYGETWNRNDTLKKGLENFSAVMTYRYQDKESSPVQLSIRDGICIYAGKENGEQHDFEMWASAENWKKILSGELGIRSSMLTKKLGFKGSMITAMKHMSAFEESIRMMSIVE